MRRGSLGWVDGDAGREQLSQFRHALALEFERFLALGDEIGLATLPCMTRSGETKIWY